MFFKSFILLCILFFNTVGECINLRTSNIFENSKEFWLAIDFDIKDGTHVTAPSTVNSGIAPQIQFENAEVDRVIWPKADSKTHDNMYDIYTKNFSVLVKLNKISDPITCKISYVLCSDGACIPINKKIDIKYNDLLSQKEIDNTLQNDLYPFWLLLILAFIGGIILNCMPCVFPVISLKIFSILNTKARNKRQIGLLFSVGVITTVVFIGILLLISKNAGTQLGWGFYMQNSAFVAFLVIIFLLSALYFFGLYILPGINIKIKNIGAFANGILTGVASCTCAGPFIGIVVSSALFLDNIILSLLVFVFVGIGLSLPVLLMCISPKLICILPKPGEWMNIMKEIIGFSLLFACIWLLFVLSGQVTNIELFTIILSCMFIAFFAWMYGKFINSRICHVFALIGLCISSYYCIFSHNCSDETKIEWIDFKSVDIEELRKGNNPIFVNFTANWCLTCAVNAKTLSSKNVKQLFKKYNVVAIKADWSKKDDIILNALKKLGVNSVPCNVMYIKGKEPCILPSIININNIEELFC